MTQSAGGIKMITNHMTASTCQGQQTGNGSQGRVTSNTVSSVKPVSHLKSKGG